MNKIMAAIIETSLQDGHQYYIKWGKNMAAIRKISKNMATIIKTSLQDGRQFYKMS